MEIFIIIRFSNVFAWLNFLEILFNSLYYFKAPSAPPSNVQDQEAAVAYARHRARTATLLVCLLGVLVLLVGVFAGICFYRQYLREKVQRLNLYMPYEPEDINSQENILLNSRWRDGPTYADSLKVEDDNNNE